MEYSPYELTFGDLNYFNSDRQSYTRTDSESSALFDDILSDWRQCDLNTDVDNIDVEPLPVSEVTPMSPEATPMAPSSDDKENDDVASILDPLLEQVFTIDHPSLFHKPERSRDHSFSSRDRSASTSDHMTNTRDHPLTSSLRGHFTSFSSRDHSMSTSPDYPVFGTPRDRAVSETGSDNFDITVMRDISKERRFSCVSSASAASSALGSPMSANGTILGASPGTIGPESPASESGSDRDSVRSDLSSSTPLFPLPRPPPSSQMILAKCDEMTANFFSIAVISNDLRNVMPGDNYFLRWISTWKAHTIPPEISFQKTLVGFSRYSEDDRFALLRSTCVELILIKSLMFADDKRLTWEVDDMNGLHLSMPFRALMGPYGDKMCQSYVEILTAFPRRYRYDVKLMIILYALVLHWPHREGVSNSDEINKDFHFYYSLLIEYLKFKNVDNLGESLGELQCLIWRVQSLASQLRKMTFTNATIRQLFLQYGCDLLLEILGFFEN